MAANEASFKNTPSEDSTLLPEKKLSPEAEGIPRVLLNCISQVKIAASMPAIRQFYNQSGVLDPDLSRLLQTHQVFLERLEKLEGQQEKQGKKEKLRMVQLKREVKNSFRDILRYFRNHPDVLSGLTAELNVEVGESESTLIEKLEMFHEDTVQNRISSPERQPKKADGELKHLQFKLDQLDREILDKKAEIRNLQEYNDMLDEEEKKTLALLKKKDEAKAMSSSSELKTGNQDIDELKAQLQSLKIEKQKTQSQLRKENEKMKMQIESFQQAFDKDMEKYQADLEVAEKKHENLLEEMKMLEESFSLLEVKTNKIQQKLRVEEERRILHLRLLKWRSQAAVVIQAAWRGYSVRKAYKNKTAGTKAKTAKKAKGKKNK